MASQLTLGFNKTDRDYLEHIEAEAEKYQAYDKALKHIKEAVSNAPEECFDFYLQSLEKFFLKADPKRFFEHLDFAQDHILAAYPPCAVEFAAATQSKRQQAKILIQELRAENEARMLQGKAYQPSIRAMVDGADLGSSHVPSSAPGEYWPLRKSERTRDFG